ncbi:hypothetical protein NHX12_018016, partial [Muraenolepis orangiensis]
SPPVGDGGGAYLLILKSDSNTEVRRAVLSCIAMLPSTLPKVLKHSLDIKGSQGDQHLDGDVVELLHRLNVENCSQIALDVLRAIFTNMSVEHLL